MENGTAFYSDREFAVVHEKSAANIFDTINAIHADPNSFPHATLGIDPATLLWDRFTEAYLDYKAVRYKKTREGMFDGQDMEIRDWGFLKKPWKTMLDRLISLQCHVIVACRRGHEDREKVSHQERPDARRVYRDR